MRTTPEHIDQWIARYLTGEASPDQIAALKAWREQSEDNREYFEQMRLIFDRASLHAGDQFDTDRAWQKVHAQIHKKGRSKVVPIDRGFKMLLRIAAAITILLVAGIFTYNYLGNRPDEVIELLSGNQVTSDTLPEGSGVFLNRQTRIRYDFDREKKLHIAKLEGEAYFDINHADGDGFVVEAGATLIRDIGTSFNVKAYPGSSTIEVVVDEGEVMFYTATNPGIHLKAPGKAVYNKDAETFTVSEPEANVTAYKTRSFNFSNDSLITVVKTLNEVYTLKFDIAENLRDCKITVSFNDEEPEEIASIIAETLGLTVTRSGDILRLEGQGCRNPLP